MSRASRRGAVLLSAARPRQWQKNFLVVAAPLSAGVDPNGAAALAVGQTFVAFCLAASSVYLLNDVCDAGEDRLHPRKRHRPVAQGDLSASTALASSTMLAVAGLGLGFAVDRELGLTIALYLAVQILYSIWLKHVTVVDLAAVSSGFLLRAVGGGVAVDVALSRWFLIVAASASMFVVAGKRFSELLRVDDTADARRCLVEYSESYLRFVWGVAAAVTVVAYSLWAFEVSSADSLTWQAVSIGPFVVALLRYAQDIDRGLAEEPEDAVLRDPVLLVLGLLWLAVFALGVYAT